MRALIRFVEISSVSTALFVGCWPCVRRNCKLLPKGCWKAPFRGFPSAKRHALTLGALEKLTSKMPVHPPLLPPPPFFAISCGLSKYPVAVPVAPSRIFSAGWRHIRTVLNLKSPYVLPCMGKTWQSIRLSPSSQNIS